MWCAEKLCQWLSQRYTADNLSPLTLISRSSIICKFWSLSIQRHEGQKECYYSIRTERTVQIYRAILFIYIYISSNKMTHKQQLNGEKWDVELGHLSAFGWAVLFSCPVLGTMLAWQLHVIGVMSFLELSRVGLLICKKKKNDRQEKLVHPVVWKQHKIKKQFYSDSSV